MPVKKIFLLVLSVFFCILLMEFFIRSNTKYYCLGYRPSRDAKIVYELQPNYSIKSLNSNISSQGLNDRYFSVKKPQGIFRIAVIGDSMSFGWKVGAHNSFPKLLENMLNENGKKYEVINFSVPGYNTSQELELLIKKAVRFGPDMIILFYCSNDIYISDLIQPKVTFLNYLYVKSYLVHFFLRHIDFGLRALHSVNIDKAREFFKKNILNMFYYNQLIYPYPGLEQAKTDPKSCHEKNVPERYSYMLGFENYKKHLLSMVTFLKKNNIEFISAGYFNTDGLTINKELNIRNICNFKEMLKENNILYSKISLSEEDMHMNIQGHSLCAKYLYEYILKNVLNNSKTIQNYAHNK